ncbi:MAG TPA: 3-hydroxyacyl-CoA dehydrogenase NAD-binding domain-containing protein, partial [bacterium]|nr:3-hydroxyacyl-CoA dehydrogenase NAD-binding domain-containing protein [bacterium]
MPIRRVGVVGAGTMGQGIIQVIAEAGIAVIFQEVNQEAIDRALAGISAALDVEVAKWGITEK